MRKMIDATSENFHVSLLHNPNPVMWGGYDTGTVRIKYTNEWDSLPDSCIRVHIDQGFLSPIRTISTVRDVEPGAWTPEDAVKLSNWDNPRPTIYCDRNDLVTVLKLGWKGDLWLAIPMGSPPVKPPVVPGCNVVAIQWKSVLWDESIVFDPYWPNPAPIKDAEVINGIINTTDSNFIPFPAGSFKQIQLYQDFNTTAGANVRVAIHSVLHGYSQIFNPFTVIGNAPITILFEESDVDGVSLVSEDNKSVGFTLA